MPVGAIIGATTLGGAVIAGNASNNATQAQQQTSATNNALQQQIFNTQRADLAPWRESGTRALAEINRRLGLTPAATTAPATPNPTTPRPLAPGTGTPVGTTLTAQLDNTPNALSDGLDQGNALAYRDHTNRPQMAGVGVDAPQINGGIGPAGGATTTSTIGTPVNPTNPSDPENRYGGFYASPGYQFRFDEGQRGINANRAASGMLQSGDTLRALTRYGQDYASNEYNTQLNQLMSVAGLGQTATGQGNALASNYANQVGQNNQNASNALQSSYGTQANTWGNALGQLGGYAAYAWPNSASSASPIDLYKNSWA